MMTTPRDDREQEASLVRCENCGVRVAPSLSDLLGHKCHPMTTTTTLTQEGKPMTTKATTASHTPGPWKIEKKAVVKRIVLDSQGRVVAVCHTDAGNIEENTRLIAAAPEGYKLLKEAYAMFNQIDFQWRDRVNAYFAQAEGRTR